jgi:excisionase family DNA binding protein
METNTLALTIADAVKASGCSRSSIYEALKRGELKARKAGRRTLIPTSELQRYLNELPEYGEAASS